MCIMLISYGLNIRFGLLIVRKIRQLSENVSEGFEVWLKYICRSLVQQEFKIGV